METLSLVIGLLGLLLAILSILLVFAVERAKAPRVRIEAGHRYWAQAPFVHIAISNHRPSGWLGRCFTGTTVTNCRASFTFVRSGVEVLGPIDGRWSGSVEPITPRDFPDSYRWDLAATGHPEQIAIARTENGVAHAFSAASYAYPRWQRPEWKLEPAEYDLVVRLAATEAQAHATLRLIVGTDGQLWLGDA